MAYYCDFGFMKPVLISIIADYYAKMSHALKNDDEAKATYYLQQIFMGLAHLYFLDSERDFEKFCRAIEDPLKEFADYLWKES